MVVMVSHDEVELARGAGLGQLVEPMDGPGDGRLDGGHGGPTEVEDIATEDELFGSDRFFADLF